MGIRKLFGDNLLKGGRKRGKYSANKKYISNSNSSNRGRITRLKERVSYDYHSVILEKSPEKAVGFGIAISGGLDNPQFGDTSIYISDVLSRSPASGKLLVNDRILSANGISFESIDYSRAIHVLRESGPTVQLIVKRRAKVTSLSQKSEATTYRLTLTKSTPPSTSYGLLRRRKKKDDDFGLVFGCKIYLKEIKNKSLLGKRELAEGDTLLKINELSIDENVSLTKIRKLIREAKERITLTLRKTNHPPHPEPQHSSSRPLSPHNIPNYNYNYEPEKFINKPPPQPPNIYNLERFYFKGGNPFSTVSGAGLNTNSNAGSLNEIQRDTNTTKIFRDYTKLFNQNVPTNTHSHTITNPTTLAAPASLFLPPSHSHSHKPLQYSQLGLALTSNLYQSQGQGQQGEIKESKSIPPPPPRTRKPLPAYFTNNNLLSNEYFPPLATQTHIQSQIHSQQSQSQNQNQHMKNNDLLPNPSSNNENFPSSSSTSAAILRSNFEEIKENDEEEIVFINKPPPPRPPPPRLEDIPEFEEICNDNEEEILEFSPPNEELRIPENRDEFQQNNSTFANEAMMRHFSPEKSQRYVFIRKEGRMLGIRIVGGNENGFFISNVHPNSLGALYELKVGDKIIKLNGTHWKDLTKEEVIQRLSSSDQIDLFLEFNPEEFQFAHSKSDSFYIQTNFNYMDKNVPKNHVPFKSGQIFHIIDTIANGNFGQWKAIRLDKNNSQVQIGIIPNKAKAQEILTNQALQLQKKQDRNLLSSINCNFHGEIGIGGGENENFLKKDISQFLPAYQKVFLRPSNFLRPVVIFGPIADLAREKLVREFPEKFDFPQSYKENKSISLGSVKELIQERKKHALLDVKPKMVEKLYNFKLHPIVIYIRVDHTDLIKEIRKGTPPARNRLGGDLICSTQRIEKKYKKCQKMYKEFSNIFTSGIKINSRDSWFRKIREVIELDQAKPIWMTEEMSIEEFPPTNSENLVNAYSPISTAHSNPLEQIGSKSFHRFSHLLQHNLDNKSHQNQHQHNQNAYEVLIEPPKRPISGRNFEDNSSTNGFFI